MRQPLIGLSLIAAVLMVAGCPAGSLTPAPKATAESTVGANRTAAVGSIVTGKVIAPANVVHILGQNNASILNQNNAAILSDGGLLYRTQQAQPERLLAGAEVYLANEANQPIPGLKPVTSDEQGRYTIKNVPAGFTYKVVVKFKTSKGAEGTLMTLTKSSSLGATADLNAYTTLVTAAVTENLKGSLGEVNLGRYGNAVTITQQNLKDAQLPNWADFSKVLDRVRALEQEVAALKTELTQLRQDFDMAMADAKKRDAEQQAQIDALLKQSPAPVPPSPAPTAAVPPIVTNPAVDFGTVQDSSGWHYRAWTGTSAIPLTYRASDQMWIVPTDEFARVHRVRGDARVVTLHPGHMHDGGMVWKAPRAGVLTIKGTATMPSYTAARVGQPSVDGATLLIHHGTLDSPRGTQLLTHTFQPDEQPFAIDKTVPVAAGEVVSFWVNRIDGSAHDTMLLDVQLNLDGQATAP